MVRDYEIVYSENGIQKTKEDLISKPKETKGVRDKNFDTCRKALIKAFEKFFKDLEKEKFDD